MKRFLLICLVILAIIVSTLAVFECIVRQHPNVYQYKNDYIIENGETIETLILGSSHTYFGIQALLFKNTHAFNLANVSQDFRYDKFLLEKYAPYCPNLKNIILPISYFSFFMGDTWGDGWWREGRYKVYMDAPFYSDFSKYNFNICHFTSFQKNLSIALKSPFKKLLGIEEVIGHDSLGMGTLYSLANKNSDWDAPGKGEEAAFNHFHHDVRFYKTDCDYFNSILSYCQDRDIDVILLTTPTWPSYYNAIDPKYEKVIQNTIDSFLVIYPNAKFRNYLRDARFTEDDFYDVDHLSDVGAEKFTKILSEDFGL